VKSRCIALMGLLIMLLAVAAACTGKTAVAPSDSDTGAASATQKDNGAGSVTLEVTWAMPDHIAEDEKLRAVADKHAGEDVVILHVTMNTHSVNLSKYDLGKVSTLEAGGDSEPAVESVSISDDEHHAETVLVFRRPAKTSTATLIVRDIGGVPERTLRWSPPPS